MGALAKAVGGLVGLLFLDLDLEGNICLWSKPLELLDQGFVSNQDMPLGTILGTKSSDLLPQFGDSTSKPFHPVSLSDVLFNVS